MIKKTKDWDADFAEFQSANPGARFADLYVSELRQKVEEGEGHSTLGARIVRKGVKRSFWDSGRKQAADEFQERGIEPMHRVIDYGCGSLRLGAHYIKYLAAGNYYGLDVTTDFIDIGRTEIGADLMAEKAPHLAAISPESIADAEAFGADFVFSNLVAYHVHPEEHAEYFGNLSRLCAKPGAKLYFDVRLSPEPRRYSKLSWSAPFEHFCAHLPELTPTLSEQRMERLHKAQRSYSPTETPPSVLLSFTRPLV